MWVSRTFSVRPGSFLLIALSFLVSFFSEINTQTPPGNPNINVVDTKNEGDTVTLTCTSFGGNPLPTVRWYKNTQLVDAGSSPNGNGDGVYTIGSTTVTYNNYTFQVSRSDNAVSFICKVNNSALTNELQRSLNIEVYVPASDPLISGPVPQVTTALDAGRTYNYTCTASSGYPVANINWKLGTSLVNSVDLHQGMSGRTVRVSESTATNSDSTLTKISLLSWIPITADNGKVLFCVTTQPVVSGGAITTATKSQSAAVFVQQIPIVQVNSSSYTVQVGQTVTMDCTVLMALPPPSTVYWSRLVNGAFNRLVIDNVRFFGSTVSNASLTITNVALSDATSYQCSATNTAGTGNSGATTLTVTGNLAQVRITESRYSVLYGGSVYMECTVQNALPPVTTVRWYKGTSLNNINTSIDVTASKFSGGVLSNPSLNITNVIPSDEGYYSCNATNLVGIASATTFLDVFGDLPSVILGNTSYTVMVGDPVTLNCDYNSSPSPNTITWQRILNAQSSNINVLDSRYGGGTIVAPYLTIHTTLLSDAGVYTCSVTNQVGTSTSQPIFLFVNGSEYDECSACRF
ncbi:roundabout homolog 1-like [Saccostrea cucullata]|uniref:roundabout homolog 1-like n=1 Tax=Saccostrea cuccullata TaxID=36930 RepID=UPI002ED4467E